MTLFYEISCTVVEQHSPGRGSPVPRFIWCYADSQVNWGLETLIRRAEHQKKSSYIQGSPQKKKSSGRSHKNRNLVREQRNKMFTVARAHAIKKSKIFSLKHNKVYN